jgi:hypothetical protein
MMAVWRNGTIDQGKLKQRARIVALRLMPRHSSGCRIDISSAAIHHILCPQCYHGSMLYRRLRQYLAVRS